VRRRARAGAATVRTMLDSASEPSPSPSDGGAGGASLVASEAAAAAEGSLGGLGAGILRVCFGV
jgi:hypothetical protein